MCLYVYVHDRVRVRVRVFVFICMCLCIRVSMYADRVCTVCKNDHRPSPPSNAMFGTCITKPSKFLHAPSRCIHNHFGRKPKHERGWLENTGWREMAHHSRVARDKLRFTTQPPGSDHTLSCGSGLRCVSHVCSRRCAGMAYDGCGYGV